MIKVFTVLLVFIHSLLSKRATQLKLFLLFLALFSEADLQRALAASRDMVELNDPTLQKALKMSMEGKAN